VSGLFASSTKQLIAGILLVDVPSGANGTVTWSEETPQGERTLLTQQTSLRPRGVLYISAPSSDTGRQGLYRVHVSIAGDERDAVFVVGATGAVSSPLRGGLRKSLRAQADTQPPPSADLAPGTTSVEETPDPCAGYTDPQDLKVCQGWYEENPTTTNGATTPYKCPSTLTPEVDIEQELWQFGGYVDIGTHLSPSDCPGLGVTLAGAVRAATPVTIAHGKEAVGWSGSTCELPGESDTFGDVVDAQGTTPGSPPVAEHVLLYEFGPLPVVKNQSPPDGSLVKSGTKISLLVLAVVEGATHGIKSLVAQGPDGAELARAGLPQPAATCDRSWPRFIQWVAVSYKVPGNPPSVIALNVSAETYDGSRFAFPVRYATKPTWSGVLSLTVDQTISTNGGKQYEEYKADVVVSEADTNKLEGQMRGEWTQTLMLPHCPAETITPGSVDAPLTGTFDSTGMHLAPGAGTSTPPVQTPCFAQQPGLMGNPLVYPELAQLLGKLEAKGNGRFEGSLEATDPGGGFPYTVRVNLQLNPGAGVPPSSPAISVSLGTPPAR